MERYGRYAIRRDGIMLKCLAIGIALSAHVGLEYEYNQVHPYAVCEKENTVYGFFHNSLDRWSFIAGRKYKLDDETHLEYGLATGYDYDVVPMVRVRHKNWFVMPTVENESNTGLVVGWTLQLRKSKE